MATTYGYTKPEKIDSKFLEQVYAPLTDKEKQLILVRNNVSGYFFDAVLKTSHQSSITITSHPVQTGANISDHAYQNPSVLIMEIGMSDVMQGIIISQFMDTSNYSVSPYSGKLIKKTYSPAPVKSRSVTAYATLLQLQSSRLPLQVVTRQKIYQNMLIENIDSPDDMKTLYGLRATITFKEIFVVQVTEKTASARPQTTGNTSKGNAQPTEPKGSLIVQWGLDKPAKR